MRLLEEVRQSIIALSVDYIGVEWSEEFHCLTFVRDLYKKVSITIPPIYPYALPPQKFNISEEDLDRWEIGYTLFLKRRKYNGKRRKWTHVGLTFPERKIIHCSDYFGGKVCVSPKDEVFSFYQYVPSETLL